MSGAQKLGRYEIQALVAKGPRGSVYLGADSEGGKPVAVKVVPRASIEPKALESFRKHAGALAQVAHPLIARFIELVETSNNVCLVTERAEGRPLATLLKDGAYPEPRIAWEIVRQVVDALAAVHAKGAVHRDIKPSNLVLAPDGRVTLVDFGTSGLYASAGEAVHYLSPEHFTGGRITLRSDLYQVGVLVYQLVTGKLPFTGTPAEIEHRVLQERPSDPSSYNGKLAWQLDWVIQKALSKDPAERFKTALEFADGLRLGLQDTVGRPLEPLTPPAVAAKPAAVKPAPAPIPAPLPAPAPASKAAAPAPATLAQNARLMADKPAAAPKPPAASKPKVLFVDDDPRILNAMQALFRQDYEVVVAPGGAEALEHFRAPGVHVIVSDQRMPGMTGVELLRQVRALAPNAMRILLTGYTDLAALVGSINQGEIFRFVKKPWENDELRKAVADAVKISLELEGRPAARAASPRTAGSLLVIDRSPGIARGLERLLAGEASVNLVATPAEAAAVLAKESIAAIVADMGAGMDGLVALFREVKAKRPETLSILLTDEPDSELAIELINRAHIFRFLPKPVSARELRTQVAAALRRYAAFGQIPTLSSDEPVPRPASPSAPPGDGPHGEVASHDRVASAA